MARRAALLRKTDGNTLPSAFVSFDCETYIQEDINTKETAFPLRFGVLELTDCKDITKPITYPAIVCKTPESIYEAIQRYAKRHKRLYIIGNNIGFDIRTAELVQSLHSAGWRSAPPIVKGRAFIWGLEKEGLKISFIDAGNFGATSVARLGTMLGYEKLDIDFTTASEKELIIYCKRDVEIVRRFFLLYLSFLHTNSLGSFKATLASQALNAYRSRFMQERITLHTNEKVTALERNSYCGGMVECHFIGIAPKQNYHKLDINSMYPSVMLKEAYPIELVGYQENITPLALSLLLNDYYCIADVELSTEITLFPLKRNNRLLFPVGTFRTTLSHKELYIGLLYGAIKTVYAVAVYHQQRIFKDYVSFFYGEKLVAEQRGDSQWREMTKLFLNSLYGKFGQEHVSRRVIGEIEKGVYWRVPGFNLDSHSHYVEYAWDGHIYKEEVGGESAHSFCAIASAVTAYARYELWRLKQIAGSGNYYYNDTDSLIVNDVGLHNLRGHINSKELGALKNEGTEQRLIIHGNKDYEFGNKIVHKGISPKAVQRGENEWEMLQFQSFLSWLNAKAASPPLAHSVVKGRRSSYDKGVVREDGGVSPLRF